MQALHGDFDADVDVTGSLRVQKAIHGDVTGEIVVGGNLVVLQALHGSILDADGDGQSVNVGGNLNMLAAFGPRPGTGALEGSVVVGGALRHLRAGRAGLSADVDVAGTVGAVHSWGGVSGDVSAGHGMRWLTARGDLTGDVSVTAGNLGRIAVRGDVTGSTVDVSGRLGLVAARGDMDNATVDAGELGRVVVRGRISEDSTDGDADEIHAASGRFFAADTTWAGVIDAGNDHFFDGVRAYVG
jgi:hypothetical protein